MKPLACVLSLLAVLAVGVLQRDPDTKELMQKLHAGKSSHLAQLRANLMGKNPDWFLAQTQARDIAKLGDALARNTPPRGNPGHFRALARTYAATARSIDQSARKAQRTEALFALSRLGLSCTPCHASHKSE